MVFFLNLLAKQCHHAHEKAIKNNTAYTDSSTLSNKKALTDSTFNLAVSKSIIFNQSVLSNQKWILTFTKLIHDSRCPTGTNCIWEGEASINVRLQALPLKTAVKDITKTFDSTFTLSTIEDPHHHNTICVNSYNITLNKLIPYPTANIKIDAAKYIATFILDKN